MVGNATWTSSIEMGKGSHCDDKISCSWCLTTHNQNQWLHTTLSEMEKSTKAMQELMKQEDGDTFAERAEMYYQRRPDLIRNVDEFRRFYHLIAEYCNHLTIRSLSRSRSSPDLTSLETSSKSKSSSRSSSNNSNNESTSTSTTNDFMEEEEHREIDQMKIPIEEKISYSVELSRNVEQTMAELARRNDKNRNEKRDLRAKIEMLTEENCALKNQLREIMFENAALQSRIERRDYSSSNRINNNNNNNNSNININSETPTAIVKTTNQKSNFSRLKSVIFSSCIVDYSYPL